jgi:hypothetical protein
MTEILKCDASVEITGDDRGDHCYLLVNHRSSVLADQISDPRLLPLIETILLEGQKLPGVGMLHLLLWRDPAIREDGTEDRTGL